MDHNHLHHLAIFHPGRHNKSIFPYKNLHLKFLFLHLRNKGSAFCLLHSRQLELIQVRQQRFNHHRAPSDAAFRGHFELGVVLIPGDAQLERGAGLSVFAAGELAGQVFVMGLKAVSNPFGKAGDRGVG